jgi:hypothetical protein
VVAGPEHAASLAWQEVVRSGNRGSSAGTHGCYGDCPSTGDCAVAPYASGMTAQVTVGPEEVRIEISDSDALPSQRRVVRIPLAAIRSIGTDARSAGRGLSALTRTAVALTGVRTGSIVHEGRRYLLAYRPGSPTVTLELDRAGFPEVGYDAVVIGVDPASAEPA